MPVTVPTAKNHLPTAMMYAIDKVLGLTTLNLLPPGLVYTVPLKGNVALTRYLRTSVSLIEPRVELIR